MLQTIRDRTQGIVASVIIIFVILTFALWGIHNYFISGGRSDVVVTVNGVEMTRQQLSLMYERLRRQPQIRTHHLTEQEDRFLRHYALQALVDTEVQRQAAVNQGYAVRNRQVNQYIARFHEFIVNGQFNFSRFKQILSKSLLSVEEFYFLVKTHLLINQVKLGIISSAFSLPNEVKRFVALVGQERKIAYIDIPLKSFISPSIKMPSKEIADYYQSHTNEFAIPEKVQVAYIELSLQDIASHIRPTQKKLAQFYRESVARSVHRERLSWSAMQKAIQKQYIMKKAEEKFLQLKDKLIEVADESPDSLKLIADKLQLPIKITPLFSRNDQMQAGILSDPNVREIVFSESVLQQKNNSDLVQLDPTRIIILRIHANHPATFLSFQAASNQIKERLALNKARNAMQLFALRLKNELKEGHSLKSMDHAFYLKTVGYVDRYSTKVSSTILEKAFHMPVPRAVMYSNTDVSQPIPIVYDLTQTSSGMVLIALSAIRNNKIAIKQGAIVSEQAQRANGLLEYELYKLSCLKHAQIRQLN